MCSGLGLGVLGFRVADVLRFRAWGFSFRLLGSRPLTVGFVV